MAMQAKDIKHGMHVTVSGNGYADTRPGHIWEVLDRAPRANVWWLHRRGDAGEWLTTEARISDMTPAGPGSRQETLITEGLGLAA